MSIRVDSFSWTSGAIVCGNRGLGVLAENIPATGDNGASFLHNDLSLPVDNGKEVCGRITTWPSSGTLFAYEDGSFEFSGAPDGVYTFDYQLYVDGTPSGTGTVSLQVGSASAAFVATTDDSTFSVSAGCGGAAQFGITTDDAIFIGGAVVRPKAKISALADDAVFAGGAYVSGSPAACLISVTADDAAFSGGANVALVPAPCSFAVLTSDAVFAGGSVVLSEYWPIESDVRLGVAYGPTGAEYVGTMLAGLGDYPSAESIAAAVVSALQGTTIQANIKQVNDVTVQGAGTKLNPWQPV